MLAKLALIPATQRVERPLHLTEYEADQFYIPGVNLKNHSSAGTLFAGIRANLTYILCKHVEGESTPFTIRA